MKITNKFSILTAILIAWLVGCGTLHKNPSVKSGDSSQWGLTVSQSRVSKAEHLDLLLRVLALELSRDSQGEATYYFQFFPERSKIEATCRLRDWERAGSSANREAVLFQTNLVRAGIADGLSGLDLGHAFEAEKHLRIRFEAAGAGGQEVAYWEAGETHWLELPAKAASDR